MIYLLFAFDDYYPAGGMGDCLGVINAADDAHAVDRAREILKGERHRDCVELVRIDPDRGWIAVEIP